MILPSSLFVSPTSHFHTNQGLRYKSKWSHIGGFCDVTPQVPNYCYGPCL